MQRSHNVFVALAGFLLAAAGLPLAGQQNFGSVAIAKSARQTVTVTIAAAGTLGNITVSTQGAVNRDFTNAGGGTCTVGTVYAAKATCTVQVAFQPTYSYVRYGAVQLTDSSASQNVMGTVYLQGSGQGPQLVYPISLENPPLLAEDCGPGSNPGSIAIDGRGYVFVSVYLNLVEYTSFTDNNSCDNGSYFKRDFGPNGLAIDGGGNLYISVGGLLKETLLPNGTYSESTVGSGFDSVFAVAVDGGGNLYLANYGGMAAPGVFKETLQPDGTYVQSTIGSGFSGPSGVAVDAAGNVYVTDYNTGNAYRETPTASGYAQSIVVTGYSFLVDVAVDSAGDVYLVDADVDQNHLQGSGIHEEAPQPDGTYVETLFPVPYNDSSLTSLVFDAADNQYMTDAFNSGAYEVNLSNPPSLLTFPSQIQGQTVTYGLNGVYVQNAGNAPMTISSIVFPKDFPMYAPNSGYCKSGTVLAPTDSCTIGLQFVPPSPLVPPATSLVIHETLQFTTNTLNTPTTISVPVTATEVEALATAPVLSIPSGSYTTPLSVTITDAMPNATIYYTNGTTYPTNTSPKYTGPIEITKSQTLVAVAYAPGFLPSERALADYVVDAVTQKPVISLAAGTYSNPQTIAITDATPGAVIYYTFNGTTPTAASSKYTGPIPLKGTATLEAIAVSAGYQTSSVASAAYEFVASPPLFSPGGGTFSGPQSVTITSPTSIALIFYTTNGTTPNSSSTRYIAPIQVTATETIRAVAVATGFTSSTVVAQSYLIEAPAATPVIAPVSGTYPSLQSVTMTDATPGATIYYTSNGAAPTASSTKYTGPFTATAGYTIQAIAIASGFSSSAVATATYASIGSPSALAAPATAVATPDATLNAVVNTLGLSGSYYFQYGTASTALSSFTAKTALGSLTTPVAASATLTTLKSKTTYYFQVVVATAGGTATGEVLSFTTN
jgi:hypothetical protein